MKQEQGITLLTRTKDKLNMDEKHEPLKSNEPEKQNSTRLNTKLKNKKVNQLPIAKPKHR